MKTTLITLISLIILFCSGCEEPLALEPSVSPAIKEAQLKEISISNFIGKDFEDIRSIFKIYSLPVPTNNMYKGYNDSKYIKEIMIKIKNNKLTFITIWLKDTSKRNLDFVEKNIRTECSIYNIRENKNLYRDWHNPLIGREYGTEFVVTFNEVDVSVMMLLSNGSSEAREELTITYIILK